MTRTALILISMLMVYSINLFAQVPDAFKYQAVLRNSDGEIISGQELSLKISILTESSTGDVVYSEEHTATTTDFGMVSLNIGEGTVVSGNFQSIEWGEDDKFLKIEMDESGGSSFSELGIFQLLSVPYALYANSAAKLGDNAVYSTSTDTLFVVKDHEGNIVFAVYPDGAEVITNKTAKGSIGGFAVSGRTSTKTDGIDILRVTPDSTRVYINESVTKRSIGGFAVSGRTSTKGEISSLMSLTRENYFIGHEAGKSNTEGLYNSFIGYKTGYSNTIGERNTFLGYFSGYTNVDGDGNIFIGDSSGYFNENGNTNVFIGNTSGKSNVSGFRNVFLGNESGYGNVDGRFNVFIGDKTGVKNTTGQQNVIIGATSGYFNTEGYRNVFVGNWSGYYNTIGSDNIFFGNRSGWNNTEGSSNVFMGSFSGFTNTTAGNNIFIGNESGYSNETGSENIFIGKESGYNNISGNLNTCIGFQSGYSLDTADYNTFLGFWAGRSNINGALNTFLGAQAGEFAENGDLNVIIGAYAGSEGVVGNFNTFVGMRAGSKNTGNNNTILGGYAGKENANGNYNVFIGQASGEFNNGSRNVFIGNGTGYENDGDFNVFIGNDAGSSVKGSNKLVIHNGDADSSQALIYGEFDTKHLRLNAYIDGIRFLNSFQVDSNYISDGNYMAFGHQGVSEDFIGYKNNSFYFLDSPEGGDTDDPNVIVGGNIGVGVLLPSFKLDVDGDVNITGSYLVDGAKGKYADYVFHDDYKLESIEEHAKFMWENKHLPALKSAKILKSGGSYDISERREQILEELEIAHIYIEQLNNQIKELKQTNNQLLNRLETIEKKLMK